MTISQRPAMIQQSYHHDDIIVKLLSVCQHSITFMQIDGW